jgi:hypothetical protein
MKRKKHHRIRARDNLSSRDNFELTTGGRLVLRDGRSYRTRATSFNIQAVRDAAMKVLSGSLTNEKISQSQ